MLREMESKITTKDNVHLIRNIFHIVVDIYIVPDVCEILRDEGKRI